MKMPYMKFYVGDWLSDPKVRRLSPAAKGLYIDLLALMWTSGEEPSLPNDVKTLAAMVGMQKAAFSKIFKEFFEKNYEIFFIVENRLYQKRIYEEWCMSNDKSKKAAESARIRWNALGAKNTCESNANAEQTQCEGNASHSYSHSYINNNNKNICALDENFYTSDFEEFWKAYPNFSRNKKGAFAKYKACLKGEKRINKATPESLLRSAKRYAEEVRGKEKQFVLHATTFLGDQERWAEYDKPLTCMSGELRDDVRREDFRIKGGSTIDAIAYERARRGLDPYVPGRGRQDNSPPDMGGI